jgi:hypothetical protein
MIYATFTDAYNFDVYKADEDLPMEMLELQFHLVSK